MVKSATCLYTVTPDAGFIIDHADPNGRVLAASACSGHGFKHSPAVGEAVAQRITDQPRQLDLRPFQYPRQE